MEKVSIIVPVYGIEKFIKRCAVSLFEQTYSNIEYIFVDDATPDGSIEIVNSVLGSYPKRADNVKIVHHQHNKGLSGARNTGLENVTGDFVLHVDGDDYLELNAVEKLIGFIHQEYADIVIFDYYTVKKGGRTPTYLKYSEKSSYIHDILVKNVSPSIWNKMYSVKLYNSGYDTLSVEGINHGEDYATTPRLLYYADKVKKLDLPLYNYVQYNENSYTQNITAKSVESMCKADLEIFRFFKDRHVDGLDIPLVLYMAMLRTKTGLLKRRNRSLYPMINDLYKDIPADYVKRLPVSDQVLLKMVTHGWYRCASIYCKMGLAVKKVFLAI